MNLTTLLLLAGGGFLLYNFFGKSLPDAIVPGNGADSGGTPTGESTVPTTPSLSSDIRTMLFNEAKKGGKLGPNSYDVWNYYYQRVRGTYGPDWEVATEKLAAGDPRQSRDFLLSLDEFLALTTPLGLGNRGMGAYTVANAWESANKRYM